MERLLLADIKGNKKFLEKLIDEKIYTPRGRLIGSVWKIYVSKRTKRPIKIIVKVPGGKRLSIDPAKIIVTERGLILHAEDTRRFEKLILELERIVREVKRLHEDILVADEKLIRGLISREDYERIRGRIEGRRAKLLIRAKSIIEEINVMRERGDIKLSVGEEKLLYRLVDYLRNSVLVVPLESINMLFT